MTWLPIDWIVETLIATTLLMIVVLLLREPVARRFGPRAAYALWLLPALRMVTPAMPAPGPLDMAAPIASLPVLHGLPPVELMLRAASPGLVESALPIVDTLILVWLAGAMIFLGVHLAAYRRFLSRVTRAAEPLPMLDRDGIEVCASGATPGPFAAGILVKQIVLPADWRRRYDAAELRLVMAHEQAHHRRCDLSANLIALLLLSLHWFNPVAHRAHRAFRADQELACDALVLDGAAPADRVAYGSALVKSSIGARPVALAPLGSGDDLKRRLRMMKGTRALPGGPTIAAVLVIGGLTLTASGGVAAETGREVAEQTVEQVREVALQTAPRAPLRARLADDPAPPAPPEVPDAPPPPELPSSPDVRRTITIERDGKRIERSWSDLSAEERREFEQTFENARIAGADARLAGLTARLAADRAIADAGTAIRAHHQAIARSIEISRNAADYAALAEQSRRQCAGEEGVSEVRVPGHRTRVVVCGTGLSDDEMRQTRIEALESARAGLENVGPDLAEEHRRAAIAGLDAEIARLRGR